MHIYTFIFQPFSIFWENIVLSVINLYWWPTAFFRRLIDIFTDSKNWYKNFFTFNNRILGDLLIFYKINWNIFEYRRRPSTTINLTKRESAYLCIKCLSLSFNLVKNFFCIPKKFIYRRAHINWLYTLTFVLPRYLKNS